MATRAEGLHENEDAKYAQKATGKELLKPQEEEQVKRFAHVVEGSNFQPEKHFYPRVLNAQLHPMVQMFMKMGNKRIAQRYCHMHPGISRVKLDEIMNYSPQYFFWAGADLFCVTNEQEQRQMIIIETNSCPSGQKSMPCDDIDENSGYHKIIKHTVLEVLETHCTLNEGALAVVFDKNHMEATGYAAVLADMIANSTLKDEKVYQVEYFVDDKNPPVRWEDGVMHIRDEKNQWIKIRACFRYVTQKPWNRFPLSSKTLVLNSIVSCLAGGRNKLMASKAYELLNMELKAEGLAIRTPETMTDVSLTEIPMYVKSMGMCAVIKNPYSNAGQGVFTVTSKKELDEFMGMKHHYDKFIVQSLVGNSGWSAMTHTGKFYHVGTVPDRKNESYVADIRMMVGGSGHGYMPIAVYARRARVPLAESLENNFSSWSMLGTNLSIKLAEGKWTSDTNRLLLMDNRDFNKLGIGLDDLIDAYVQTVLSCMAIDRMCKKLMVPNKKEDRSKDFNWKLFFSLDHDEALMSELKEINGFGTETEMEQEQTRIH